MCIMNYVRRPSLATYTFSLAQTSYKLKTKLTLVGNMSHTRETDSEINSGREKFVNENFAELFENMAKMMTEIERIKKMITDQHKKLDRKLTDYQGEMRKEMKKVKTRLDKIEKITDRVEKNEDAIQVIKTTLKDKIEDINRNNIMEEASRSVYIHNVDVLIGMH